MFLTLASIWLALLFGGYVGYQLLKQNGRILIALEKLEVRLDGGLMQSNASGQSVPVGLPLHSSAPEFKLPQLSGGEKALSDFKGQRLVLLFFNPQCGFCQEMVPQLASLDGQNPIPLIVTTGDVKRNQDLFEKHGLRSTVLVQQQMEIASQYLIGGTPMGYLIDEEGRIVSDLAAGAEAILALFAVDTRKPAAAAQPSNGHKSFRGNRTLADSRITRDGLKPGTEAPNFRLPLLNGGEFCLQDYRGKQLLLVFSAPDCAPCNLLAPKLEQQQRLHPEIQVAMVSRGDQQAINAKVKEYGLTFPVAIQAHWEISRLYGTFATPVAYYIDENGIIASEVAMGENPILELFSVGMPRAA